MPTNSEQLQSMGNNADTRPKISTNNIVANTPQSLESGGAGRDAVPHLQIETYLGDRFFAATENSWRRPDRMDGLDR